MAWWIPLAMAAGGYVIDKQMGGDGKKGALLGLAGGAMLPAAPALASGTAATTAGTLGPTGATMTGFAGAGGSGLLGGTTTAANLGGGYASGSLGGMTGFSPAAQTVLPNAMPVAATGSYPSSLTTGSQGVPTNNLSSLLTQGKDFVVDGFSDMSFADQLGVGMQAQGLLNRPTQRMEAPRPGMAQRKETVFAPPLNSQIQNTQMPTEEEKLRSQYLNRPNFYG
tara:strand:- start:1266 stop:1937 length:672 start_codon:yes stop_codon:yes gene_type:complete